MTNHKKSKFVPARGTRAQVYKGLAKATSGGLTKKDLIAKKDKNGNVIKYISLARSLASKKQLEENSALRDLLSANRASPFKEKASAKAKSAPKKRKSAPASRKKRKSARASRKKKARRSRSA